MPRQKCFKKKGWDRVRELSRHLSRSTSGKDPSQDRRYETQHLLRGEGTAAGGAVRVSPTSFDDGYDVRGPQAIRDGKEGARTAVPIFRRRAEGIQLCRSHTSLAGANSLQSTTTDDITNPPIPRWWRACVRSSDGRYLEWFAVAQRLRQGCVLSPLLFNIFSAAVLLVALERFSKDAG